MLQEAKEKDIEGLYKKSVEEMFKFFNEKSLDAINYFNKFPKYNINSIEYFNLFKYLSNTADTYNKFFIAVESSDRKYTHGERYGNHILAHLLERFYNKGESNKGYSLNLDYIMRSKSFEIGDIEKKFKGSFVVIKHLDILLDSDIQDQKQFIKYLNKIEDAVIVLRGSKQELETIFALMDIKPSFYFNYESSYSIEELIYVIETDLKKKGFIFEENWEKYLRMFLSKPSESNRKRGYNYYYYLIEELKKKAFIDIEQKKIGKNILIKNEYFGVTEENLELKNIKSLKKLDKLIGMNEVKNSIQELIAYLEFIRKVEAKTGNIVPLNLHMMFTGSPGTGKTTIARIIAEILYELGYIKENKLVEVDKKDLVGEYVGHTPQKTNDVIQRAKGGVLFIDEAYSIVDDKFGKESIATLIKAMEDYKGELVVIVAGYKDEMKKFVDSNPGMKSRLGKKIHFEDYTTEELIDIYNIKLTDFQIKTDEEAMKVINEIISIKRLEENFGNGRFINNLIQDILFQHAVNTKGVIDEDAIFTLSEKDIPIKYFETEEV